MAGGEDKIVGKGKEALGTVTGDESKKNEGKAQNAGGQIQDAASNVAKTVSDAAQSAKEAVVGK